MRRPGYPLAEHDFLRTLVLAAVRQRIAILDNHRGEPRVAPETNPHELGDGVVVALCSHDLVRARLLVEHGHRCGVEAGYLARGGDSCSDDVRLGERGPERLSCSVKLSLLDLGPFELHEHPLVLDGPLAESGGLGSDFYFVRGKRRVLDAIHDENAP
jgi:hypothetical protein